MYKILISHQDENHVCLIRDNILSSRDDVFIYCANSGKDTMDIVKREKPNIIFLAIELMDISGIDVARELVTYDPNVHIVFISCYDYFEFARTAMNLGVDDYLLEPVTKQDIISVINRIIEKIDAEQACNKHRERNDELMENSKDLLGYGFIYSVLYDNNVKNNILEYKQTLGISDKGYWYNIEVQSNEYKTRVNDQEIINTVKDVLSKNVKYVMGPRMADRIPVYISIEENDIRFNDDKFMIEIGKMIKREVQSVCKMNVNIGMGSIHELNDIYISYEESLKSLRNKNDIVKYTGSIGNDEYVKCMILEKRLLEGIEIGKEDVRKVFSLLLEQYEKHDIRERKNNIFELFVVITHKINGMGSCEWDATDSLKMYDDLMELKEDEIDLYARNKFEYLLKTTCNASPTNLSETVKIAVHYMYEHYNENISLNEIARMVGVSVQYFSKIFKDDMGCNYVDWLNTLRIKRAKELMNTTHLSIKEVGFKVGYNDPNYFSRIFKKYEGVAPTEYVGRREVS